MPQRAAQQVMAESEPLSLARAFASFTEAAGSLERSYGHLHMEVVRLRRELEETNCDLARSLEENHRIRQHLNRIVEGLPCGVLVCDTAGRISLLNPEARRLLGRDEAALGQTLAQLDGESGRLLAAAAEGCAGEQEHHYRPGDGAANRGADNAAARWLAVRHVHLENDDQGSDAIFILRDITEQKRLEQERERARRMEALAEMSTLLAHEIRNPLGSLELFAGLLAETAAAEGESRRWVAHLQAGLRTLAATVNNVLHFHSLPTPQLVAVDMAELLRTTAEFLLPLARQAGVRLEVDNCLRGVVIAADPHRLRQVLLNLALNSFRFMSGGGVLRLAGGGVREAGKTQARLAVADTGEGIPAENLPRIFEAGFTTRPGSPGLGLAVCQKIVEQHGGTIRVESLPGQGATFTLSFPWS